MATSPNYGWSEPDNTSLVKDGAQAMRTLGDAIDTSVWNVGFGQAGKNKIINGDFSVNQRNFTSTTSSVYGFDRWFLIAADGTSTYSAQVFTPGEAPVAGYESTNFARLISTGQTLSSARTLLSQRIEDVRIFAGQNATVSFWAKAATGTPSVAVNVLQNFGSGGSTPLEINGQKTAITSSWARYSLTFSIPTLSGKTVGSGSNSQWRIYTSAGSDFDTSSGSLGIQSATIDFWGVQIEYGSKATPFQTASGNSIQGELAMCQRYCMVYNGNSNVGSGTASSISGIPRMVFSLPVEMRTTPSASYTGTPQAYDGSTTTNLASFGTMHSGAKNNVTMDIATAAGLTVFRTYNLYINNATIIFSAEL